jgi:hypothetical protein
MWIRLLGLWWWTYGGPPPGSRESWNCFSRACGR